MDAILLQEAEKGRGANHRSIFLRIYLESMRPVLPGSLCFFVVQTEGRGRDRLQERQRVKRGRAGREVGRCKCDARQSQIDDPLTCLRADILERVKVPPS